MVIGTFDWWEENGTLEFQQENVRIYRMDNETYLFVGPVMYASTTERSWYGNNVFPHVTGKCLEIGLGLGVASKVILARPDMSHLLTIEKNENVIAAFGRPLLRHNILHADVTEWVTSLVNWEPMYDFIFVDHYTFEEEELELLDWLASSLKMLLTPNGKMVFWIDENAPDEDKEEIKKLWVLN